MPRCPALAVVFGATLALLPWWRLSAQEDAGGGKPSAENEAALAQIRIKGALEEGLPQQNPFGPSPLHFKGLLDLIRKAKADPAVAGIHLTVDSPDIGLARARELVGALKDFRASGKKIFAFAESAAPIDVILLSPSTKLVMPESALVLLPGVSAEVPYLKGFFDKIGVRFLVSHVGEYKTAFENFAEPAMSPAYRETLEDLVESSYQAMQEVIADARGIPKAKVAAAMDRAFLSAADMKEHGLIDEVAHRERFWESVKAELAVSRLKLLKNYGQRSVEQDLGNPMVLLRLLMEAFSPPAARASTKPKIALVYASGMILGGKSQADPFTGASSVGSETMVEALKSAADDETVKAIVLRINSPGGSGVASDAIWRAVSEARARKPVVASMSDVAGSGGYYIAMAANRIIAQPETLTGSIGVVSAMVNLRKTMDLLAIRIERVSRGRNAHQLSPFADPEDVSLEPLTKFMERFYEQFVDKAAAGRGQSSEAIRAVARGRVWTGRQALEHKLVDELGGLEKALALARELARVTPEEEVEILELPRPLNLLESISEAFGMARAGAFAALPMEESQLLKRVPELQEIAPGALELLQAARDRVLLYMPVSLRLR